MLKKKRTAPQKFCVQLLGCSSHGMGDFFLLSIRQSQSAQEPDRFLIIFGISSEPFHYTFTHIHLTPLFRFRLRGSVNVG